MFCEKCGNELDNNQTVCPYCGESTELLYDNSSLEENNNYNLDMNDTTSKSQAQKSYPFYKHYSADSCNYINCLSFYI